MSRLRSSTVNWKLVCFKFRCLSQKVPTITTYGNWQCEEKGCRGEDWQPVSASLSLRDTPELSPHPWPQAPPHLWNIITAEYRGWWRCGSTKKEPNTVTLATAPARRGLMIQGVVTHSKGTQNYVHGITWLFYMWHNPYIFVLQQTDIAMVSSTITLTVSPL